LRSDGSETLEWAVALDLVNVALLGVGLLLAPREGGWRRAQSGAGSWKRDPSGTAQRTCAVCTRKIVHSWGLS